MSMLGNILVFMELSAGVKVDINSIVAITLGLLTKKYVVP